MNVLRRLLSFIAVGGVLGDLIAMWLAPSAITWFISLPAQSSLCNCVESATRTAEALIRWQLIGTGLGAVTGGVIGELATRSFLSWKQRRAASKEPAKDGGPPAAGPAAPAAPPPADGAPPPTA